ncbi:MAG: ABC transporter substrate-binding protein, partial [Actinobacteria bacterium]|nr:ABC transporter substrate-binding protein [Actinomycetota bacterium]
MTPASTRNRGIRWIAALGATLLVAGCGTRLDNARIEAAAGVNQAAVGGGELGPTAGAVTSGDVASGVSSNAGAVQAAGGEAASSAAGTHGGATSGAATPGAVTSAGSAGATKTGGATSRVASGTSGGGGGAGAAATSANAANAGTATATPGAPTPTPGAGGAAATPGAKTPIVLGHIGDYSGLIGTLMKGGEVTAQVVARYVNDNGGLDGHPIKVIVGDAGGDPARALSLVRDMVENKGAIAMFGTLMVFSGYGPRDYLEQHKIPIIGGDGTTNAWLESPMYFTSSANFPGISYGAIKGLADLGKKKVAILYCVEA